MTNAHDLAARMFEISDRDDTTGLAADALREGGEMLIALASGTEARSGETEGLDPKGDGPPEGDAQ